MNERQRQMDRIIAKARAGEAFKARLIADPVATLRAEGIAVPDGVTLSVREDTPTHLHIVLPPQPLEGEVPDTVLEAVSGGLGGDVPGQNLRGLALDIANSGVFHG